MEPLSQPPEPVKSENLPEASGVKSVDSTDSAAEETAIASATNDVFSPAFVSKLDPFFTSAVELP